MSVTRELPERSIKSSVLVLKPRALVEWDVAGNVVEHLSP